jgi:hypothetical protein
MGQECVPPSPGGAGETEDAGGWGGDEFAEVAGDAAAEADGDADCVGVGDGDGRVGVGVSAPDAMFSFPGWTGVRVANSVAVGDGDGVGVDGALTYVLQSAEQLRPYQLIV